MTRPTNRIRELGPDWDGYGARRPDPAACDRADALVTLLRLAGIEPSVCPTSRGGVELEWTSPEHEGLIELLPVAE